MLKFDQVGDMTHFSVNSSMRIAGMPYRPSICYQIQESIAKTVKELADAGKATLYTEAQRFVNGIARPAKKPQE